MTSPLFEEFSVRGLTLPNRIVMAPMTRNFAKDGVPGAHNAEYYRKRAEGGTGLIVTEGTVVARSGAANHPDIPHFHGEEALAGWKQVADAVHEVGGKIAPQIWHTGAVKAQRPDTPHPGEPEGPSGIGMPGKPLGKAMTEEDVEDTVAAFVSAAKDAQRLGFDTIEFHGAHGYLIDQFFWDGTNQREDRWGGDSVAARTAFATEILKRTRKEVGEDMPIILRISQWNQQDYARRLATTPDELEAWVAPLVDAGADVLHCSQRRFWEPEFPEIDGEKGLNFAGWVKKIAGVPTISVGSVALDGDFFQTFKGETMGATDLGDLEERMDRGEFDLIAVGRALIANPDWANMVREGRVADLQGYRAEQLGELV